MGEQASVIRGGDRDFRKVDETETFRFSVLNSLKRQIILSYIIRYLIQELDTHDEDTSPDYPHTRIGAS